MKKIYTLVILSIIFITSPISSYAISNFDTSSGVLVVPRVSADGQAYFDNVSLELDFATGKFKLLNHTPVTPPQPDQIIETQDAEKFTMGFQGCFRSGRDSVMCYVKLTNNDFDREITVEVTGGGFSAPLSKLFDDLGNEYPATKISVANTDVTRNTEGITLVRGVPVTAIFEFNEVSPSATSLSLFQPGFSAPVRVHFQGDFRSFNGSFF